MNRPDYDFILNELNVRIADFNNYLSFKNKVKIEETYFEILNNEKNAFISSKNTQKKGLFIVQQSFCFNCFQEYQEFLKYS